MLKPVALMGAMDCEVELFLSHMEQVEKKQEPFFHFYTGLLHGCPVVLSRSGVGKVLATMVAQALIERFKPSCLLFTGIAGSLNPSYEIGDVVAGKDLVQHDMDVRPLGFPRGQIAYTDWRFFDADPVLLEKALACQLPDHSIHSGRILTGDQFIAHHSRNELKYLTEELGGDAVEMEGASVAMVATLLNVPFLVIRTISDRANGAAPADFEAFLPRASENSFQVVSHLISSL